MPKQTAKLAVMFADICGSTALYDSLGDDMARRLIARCIATMNKEVAAQHGTLIKTIGDEIMCTFPSAEAAMQAACAMQRAVENGKHEDGHAMHIRVGFHYGDVICEAGDVFGDTVNVAARVASITRCAQVMTTQAVVDALPPDLRDKTRQLMRAEFKGKQEELDIFLVVWEMDDMMSTRVGTPAFRRSSDNIDELTLRYHDQTLKVNRERRSVMLGRGDNCDLVVRNDFASRQHVRFELRFGKFVIADQSTNGTYIRINNGNATRLSREEMVMQGSGTISLGQPLADNHADIVEFSILSNHTQQ
ncbi:MAG TPA: adenylate/guanylate cyclase domain-containing protein [Gallionella sp.]|nr:adenylate/guanylate cyclase domain-containing protein [Gallionella sp.]